MIIYKAPLFINDELYKIMRVNNLYLIIAVLLSALLAWGGYAISNYTDRNIYVLVTLFVSLGVTSVCGLALDYEEHRSGVMIKTASWSFFMVLLIMDYVFAFFHFNIPLFIICNGVILLVSIVVVSSVYKTKM